MFTTTIGTLAVLGCYTVDGRHALSIVAFPLVTAIGTAFIEEIVFRGILVSGPEWLSGGAFGAGASIVAVMLGVALGTTLLVMAWRRGRFIAPYWRSTLDRPIPA